MELKSGVTLHNTYRIIRVLGQGGFGITYLAEHLLLEQQVAIKEFFPKALCNRDANTSNVRPGTQANTEQVEKLKKKFLKEATHIAKLSNPNIIRIRDVFEQNDTAYYVMDYIDGYTLDVPIKKHGPMPLSQALKYINEIGQALSYVHSKHLNHLDIKPGNIIIRKSDDTAILLDFGLSKQYDTTGHETSSTPIGVSHGYAPIEQYQEGGVKEFSPQTDLYSLAATLYYLITGLTPAHATALIDDTLYIPTSIPPHIAFAIRKAMSTSKKQRHESIQAFLNEINGKTSSSFINEQTQIISEPPANVIPPKVPNKQTQTKNNSANNFQWLAIGIIIIAVGCLILFLISKGSNRSYSDVDSDTIEAAVAEPAAIYEDVDGIPYLRYSLGNGTFRVPDFLSYCDDCVTSEGYPSEYIFIDDVGATALYVGRKYDVSPEDFEEWVTYSVGNGNPLYVFSKENYAVQSGYNDSGEIYYAKWYMDYGTSTLYTMLMTFPESEKPKYENIITKMFNPFPNLK